MENRSLDITDDINGLKKDLIDLKSSQYVSKKSILNYDTYSVDRYDYDFIITESNKIRYFRINFNHASAKQKTLLHLTIFYREDNYDVMAGPTPYKTPTAPPLSTRWKKDMPYGDTTTSWTVKVIKGVQGVNSYHAYFKFYISGTDTGSWTVTPL